MARRFYAPYQSEPVSSLATWSRNLAIFSVVAVVFLPPTLVASIYGMNFDIMPELHWMAGYPWALGLMLVSAVIPLLYFRRKGWL